MNPIPALLENLRNCPLPEVDSLRMVLADALDDAQRHKDAAFIRSLTIQEATHKTPFLTRAGLKDASKQYGTHDECLQHLRYRVLRRLSATPQLREPLSDKLNRAFGPNREHPPQK